MIGELKNIPLMPEHLKFAGRIGKGGAGEVFKVVDVTGKHLALKKITDSWQQQELAAISRLRNLPVHENLTQIFHAGKMPDGNFYYTMELADNANPNGEYLPDTLVYRMRNNLPGADELCRILADVASGVEHMHKYGLFHGDIKPENIIFINGVAKLADFGCIAPDGNAGTCGFVPENPVSMTDRDCYAVCKTLYCVWSQLEASEYPTLPEKFDSHELRLIRRIYLKGCSDKVMHRFADAGELRHALLDCSSSLQCKNTGKSIVILTLSIILAVAAAAFTGWIVWQKYSDGTTPPVTQSASGDPVENNRALYRENEEMYRFVKFSEDLTGEFSGMKDFRNRFESVYKVAPEKLPPEQTDFILDFYRDYDRLAKLRKLLADASIPEDERLKLYKNSNYKELYLKLHKNSLEPDHQYCNTIARLFVELGLHRE